MTEEQTLQKLIKARTVVKGQFTRANRLLKGNPTATELNVKLTTVTEYWTKYKQIQDEIDSRTDLDELSREIECRCSMEDEYLQITTTLQEMMLAVEQKNS